MAQGAGVEIYAPLQLRPDSTYGFFVRFTEDVPVAGIALTIPPDWVVDTLRVFDERQLQVLSWYEEDTYRYRFSRAGERVLVQVRLRTGTEEGAMRFGVAPVFEDGIRGARVDTWVQISSESSGKRQEQALYAAGKETWHQSVEPPLWIVGAYEVSGWIRSLDFPAVVVTSWSGREGEPYPFEWLLDARGIPVFYRGDEAAHESLIGRRPVADGVWHHVRMQLDENGWMRLWVDGRLEDSLQTAIGMRTYSLDRITWGGRGASVFQGYLDDWKVALLEEKNAGDACPEHARCFSFDDEASVQAIPPGFRLVPTLRVEEQGIRLRSAHVEAGWVTLSWEGPAPLKEDAYFRIERSEDGKDFMEVGRVHVATGLAMGGGQGQYLFTDQFHGGQRGVVYYRIQLIEEGVPVGGTGMIKIGLAEQEEEGSHLIGNFPNPVFHRTVIRYRLVRDTFVRLSLWELSGHLVDVLEEGFRLAGVQEFVLPVDKLPSGTYIIRLETEEGVDTHTLIVMR